MLLLCDPYQVRHSFVPFLWIKFWMLPSLDLFFLTVAFSFLFPFWFSVSEGGTRLALREAVADRV